METMRVFSWFSARPRSARNASTLGRMYRSRTSFDGAVTRKSSAYLIRTTLLSIPLFVTALTGLPSQSSQPKSRSIPSSATLANTGERIPPCGVPASLACQAPMSIEPALSQCSIVLVKVGSFVSNGLWAIASKQPLLAERGEDRLDRVHRAPSGPEPVAVRLEACLPFGFQRQLDDSLHHAVLDGRNAQGTHLAVGLRDVDPSDRLWLVSLEVQTALQQRHPIFRRPAHHAVDAGCIPACIPLGHLADRQQLRRPGAGEQLL